MGKPFRPQSASETDIRPIVAKRGGNTPVWLLIGGVLLGGLLLFGVLDSQRRALTAPTIQTHAADALQGSDALPPLYIPPEPPLPPPPPEMAQTLSPIPSAMPPASQHPASSFAAQPPPVNYPPPPWLSSPQPTPVLAPPPQSASSSAVLVIDTTTGSATTANDASTAASAQEVKPVEATQLNRRATTVPQGTLIQAVLETALDSTRPGYVRAIVSRDVTGFDGSRVLIPRGTRLFGDYQADMAAGQRRALVQWTRLVRPDGVTVALASPAADIQGRAGIEGRVNNHFLARFGDALLQTTLNVGANLAGRSLSRDAPVVVALPGAIQGVAASTTNSRPQPTLRVDAGVRVTAFVARDLEFSSGEMLR